MSVIISSLKSLKQSIDTLYGVGPALVKAMERLAGPRILDALFHVPTALEERCFVDTVSGEMVDKTITVKAKVLCHRPPSGGVRSRSYQPYRVQCQVGDTMLSLVFFRGNGRHLKTMLPEQQIVVVSGKLELFKGQWQMSHPDHVGPTETLKEWVGVKPVYPLTQSLTQKALHKIQYNVLRYIPDVPDWLSPKTRSWHKTWRPWKQAITGVHNPKTQADILPSHPDRERLAFDELFANQLALQLVRLSYKKKQGLSKAMRTDLYQRALDSIPFVLTGDQTTVLQDIHKDLSSPTIMNRLLQGDVGSGKTIVAFLSAIVVIDNGFQTALMAPTEILAKQHFETLEPFFTALGLQVALLIGKMRKSEKNKVYQGLESGDIHMVIGTHALIQDDVLYHNLGLTIIDEQHRFGVQQRLKLAQKGVTVDHLSMTATPIPRTLMMASYGDLDTSQLREKPAGRKPIHTSMVSLMRQEEVVEGLKRTIAKEGKAYWVCPLVEESEALDLAAAEDRFEALAYTFPNKVGLVHGKMKSADKDKVMADFHSGKINILVATTVIEVGVNDPDATVIVIEHAERFGLAQLHQLRGRVGRSDQQSYCVLLYDAKLSRAAQSRLAIMRQSNDGFEIAEEDWRIRGGGEVLGLRQSGLPDFTFVDWSVHESLLKEASLDAETLLTQDPELQKTDQGRAAKVLLDLFDKDNVMKALDAG